MGNILNNNHSVMELKLSESDYWDFTLSKENDLIERLDGTNLYDQNLINCIDINNPNCVGDEYINSLESYKWPSSVNYGLELKNSGFNFVDNGRILFDIDSISQDEFVSLLTGTTFSLPSGDTKLYLYPVSGNTKDYLYDYSYVIENNVKSLRLDGGFYQGIFKSGDDYEIVPDFISDEMTFEFILKPDFSKIITGNTLNNKYPDNKGLFFYLGVKSEEKFIYDYNKNFDKYQISKNNQVSIIDDSFTLKTDDGFDVKNYNLYDIETDNLHLLLNRTGSGMTHKDYDPNVEYHVTGNTFENVNLYPYLNRTSTGYTASNMNSISGMTKEYDFVNDLINNEIGFRIKDDGSIGYRLIGESCEDDYNIIEEYSNPDIIKDGEVSILTIRFIMSEYSDCKSDRIFKINFYVNGKLIFVSKELKELDFRPFNDRLVKQENLPFSISIGGGTQGLCDMISLNSNYNTQYLLPIEKYFAGSFIGNIYKFRIFYGKMDYSKIFNNFLHENKNNTWQ